jgi:hypothetical protein
VNRSLAGELEPGDVIAWVPVDADPPAERRAVNVGGYERLSYCFGLSYASWLTMPRVLMEAMPDEWQGKMAELWEEWDRTWKTDQYGGTRVQIVDGVGRMVKTDPRLLNYRYPDHSWIGSLRRGPMQIDGKPIACGHTDLVRTCEICTGAVNEALGIMPKVEGLWTTP